MVLGIQIIGLFFSLFMIYYTFLHFKRKDFSLKEFSLWFLLWVVFIILAIFPQLLDPVITKIDIGRKMDFFIIAGFFFLVGITTYIYTIVRKTQNKIDEVVSRIAIENAEDSERLKKR